MNEAYETDGDQAVPTYQHLPAQADPVGDVADEVAPATGHRGVDEVLASLDALDAAEVSQHVAVFEQAHASLRGILNDATASSQS